MKFKYAGLLLFVLIFTLNKNCFCQTTTDVKVLFTNIYDLCKAKKYDEAGKFVAFYSNDKKKEYKIPDPSNTEHSKYILRVVKRIEALSEISGTYVISSVLKDKKNNLDFQNVMVEFTSGTQKIKQIFRFVTLEGKLLLAEID